MLPIVLPPRPVPADGRPPSEAEIIRARIDRARRWHRKRTLYRWALRLGLRRPRHSAPLDGGPATYYPSAVSGTRIRRWDQCGGPLRS